MIGAGTIINPIVKVVTTVAILAAVYFFIVKPALDTTEEIARTAGSGSVFSGSSSGGSGGDADLAHQRSRAESYVSSLLSSWPQAAREVRGCIREAAKNAQAMERCAEQGLTIVHRVNSNRSFARSYANSLALQGRGTDTQRVEDCVEEAGFKVGAMQRCRNLADRLLFGVR